MYYFPLKGKKYLVGLFGITVNICHICAYFSSLSVKYHGRLLSVKPKIRKGYVVYLACDTNFPAICGIKYGKLYNIRDFCMEKIWFIKFMANANRKS